MAGAMYYWGAHIFNFCRVPCVMPSDLLNPDLKWPDLIGTALLMVAIYLLISRIMAEFMLWAFEPSFQLLGATGNAVDIREEEADTSNGVNEVNE